MQKNNDYENQEVNGCGIILAYLFAIVGAFDSIVGIILLFVTQDVSEIFMILSGILAIVGGCCLFIVLKPMKKKESNIKKHTRKLAQKWWFWVVLLLAFITSVILCYSTSGMFDDISNAIFSDSESDWKMDKNGNYYNQDGYYDDNGNGHFDEDDLYGNGKSWSYLD